MSFNNVLIDTDRAQDKKLNMKIKQEKENHLHTYSSLMDPGEGKMNSS